MAPINIPVITADRIKSLQHGEEMLERGSAEIIGYCWLMLCDHERIAKQAEGREREIV